ncbi:predicted protein [Naegleria gruberi]|uniref:Predicted protein n=1 Tax=Naegleria gruberi TaxID=5762 RepID=D2VYF3_NAEGR|nr:uncharacterized protein NAEGRDRAFT_74100 [Naegleria gruberi]EFC38200.1 predicted protein [Naegleria gruberi]|eukprot:XP_002670944.1 predicted protein [Naegleria gruberi strain NEG-M]
MIISETYGNRIRRVLTNGTIIPLAGSGSSNDCAGITASNTPLVSPKGTYFSANGDIYVAETQGHRISRISKNGMIDSIAGTGKFGFNGDNLFATDTQLSNPFAVAFDLETQLIVSDSGNHVIRKILRNGTMVIIAGTGQSGYNGDGIDAKIAKLNNPSGIVVDSKTGELFIADTANNRIRKILTNGTIITIAGTGETGYNGDGIDATSAQIRGVYGIALDVNSELYIADANNYRIRKILSNGTIITIAGNGGYGFIDNVLATNAKLAFVNGIAVDTNGEVYITESENGFSNHRIRKILTNGTIITFSGTGSRGYYGDNVEAADAKFYTPYFVSVRQTTGEVLISDTGNNFLRLVSTTRLCNGTLASDPMVCSGHGICYLTDVCTCNPGYIGSLCDVVACNGFNSSDPRACNGHGICEGPNICNCTTGYVGSFCDVSLCYGFNSSDSRVCNGHGICEGPDICNCSTGYIGPLCDDVACDGFNSSDSRACNGHGICEGPNICNCSTGYIGSFCDVVACDGFKISDPRACNRHGICEGPNICNCTTGYVGSFCDVSLCYGFNSSDPRVCNGHGICEGPDVCNCTTGYVGSFCDVVACDGFNSSDSRACNRHGICEGPNICNCTTGYVGSFCDVSLCYGFNSSDPRVCNRHGICEGPNICNCTTGYVGSFCDVSLCYGFNSSDPRACNGHGICEGPDVCNCTTGYVGSFCDVSLCNGFNSSDPRVCNGHGICEGPNIFTIQTSSEQLYANLFIDTISSKKVTLVVANQDLEQSNEAETWSYVCQDENFTNCGQTIANILSNYASIKSKTLELSADNFPSIDSTYSITLNIVKGVRSFSSLISLKFPKENQKLPPIVNLLNVIPNRNRLSKSEFLNLQISVTNSDGLDVKNLKREWKLNGQSIDDNYLTKMSTALSDSNNIVLSITYLDEGSSNVLTCQVTDLDSQLSSTFSYSFSIITSPKPCPCSVSPSTGYALETEFTFSCTNCQNKDNTLAFSLSFVDDKSGALIPLVIEGGNTFTTKLPYPISNPLMFDITIVDIETLASVQNYQNIQMILPKASSVREVKTKVAKWNTFQTSLQQNDLRRMIFSSAIISRTSEAMISAISGRRSICLNGGVYNSQLRKCICVNGYKKKDCSLNEEDFTLLTEFKGELFNNFLFAFKNRQEQMSEMYIIYQLYGLDSLLSNYDELNAEMFANGVQFFKDLISSAVSVSNLHLRPGIDKLTQNIINSLYRYLIYNGCIEKECLRDHVIEMISMLKEISQLLLRSKLVGESDLKLDTDFMVLLTNKNYRYHFNSLKVQNLTLPTNDEGISSINNRMLLSFISTSSHNLANKIESTIEVYEKVENNRKETQTITKDYSITSNVISFSFLRDLQMNQSISFSFPRNDQFSARSEQSFEYSCIVIWNITQVRPENENNNCKIVVNQETIICQCPYQNQTQVGVLRTAISRRVSVEQVAQPSDSSNLLYLLFLLFLVLFIILIVIIIGIVIVCLVKRRRNGGSKKSAAHVEMETVKTSTV